MQEQETLPEPPVHDPPPGSGLLRGVSTAFYGLLLAAALAWTRLRTGEWLPASATGGDPPASLLLGAVTAVSVILLSGLMLERIRWMRWFAREIRELLGPVGGGAALHLALASGIAEELLFRGAMQPVLGYAVTSVLFGAVHVGPGPRYLGWTLFALVLGFVLGGIQELTGSLWGPVLAHVAINLVNLRRIGRMDLREGSSGA